MWGIPPSRLMIFSKMEIAFDLNKHQYDQLDSLVGIDESPKQLIADTRILITAKYHKSQSYYY